MHHTQPIPYGMYLVDKSYIDELRKHESKIIGSDVTNLYCGPVLRVDDEWAFYAPVLPMPDYVNDELFLSKDMAVSGFVYVCKMNTLLYKGFDCVYGEYSRKRVLPEVGEQATYRVDGKNSI